MITTTKSKKDGTTINICNYAAYQDFPVDAGSSNGHRTSALYEKSGEKNALKNVKNRTADKTDVCADTQGFSTPEGQPNGQPTGHPDGQPAGHKQEVKNEKNDQEKKEKHPRPAEGGALPGRPLWPLRHA